MFKKYKLVSILSYLLFIMLSNSSQVIANTAEIDTSYLPINSTLSATFSPDGRLWRLIPTKNAIYVDYSLDNGSTYSQAIQVNKFEQKMSAWPENPPTIKVSPSGRINILYYADTKQKSTSFFSYSDDNGQTFSPPSLISDHAESAMHYMDKMLVDKNNNVYLFWHDTRHESHDQTLGPGVLSLYYSVKEPSEKSPFSNHFLSSGICSCCRTATALDMDEKPVVLARMVYENGIRDHALIRIDKNDRWQTAQRVTYDHWKIEACPEHGPSITIDNKNRSHLTWFTLGASRKGIFYAQTDDFGKTMSAPLALGNSDHLPSHPDVIALNQRVVIAWKEFDGEQSTIHIKQSDDRGLSWTESSTELKSSTKNGYPKLMTNHSDIFLSWTSKDKGFQVIKL